MKTAARLYKYPYHEQLMIYPVTNRICGIIGRKTAYSDHRKACDEIKELLAVMANVDTDGRAAKKEHAQR